MCWLIAIANMPGPQFLKLYAAVIFLTLVGCWLWAHYLQSNRGVSPQTDPKDPDPFEVAFLRGGENEVTRLAVFDLIQHGYLEAVPAAADELRRTEDHPDPHHLSTIESVVFDYFVISRKASEIFDTVPEKVRLQCQAYQERLEREGLLVTPDEKERASIPIAAGAFVIFGLGGYKLIVALSKGKTNVFFLIMMGIASLVALVRLCWPRRVTRAGRQYLDSLQARYDRLGPGNWLGDEKVAKLGPDPTLLLAMGLFGTGILAGTQYDFFSTMFQKAQAGGWYGGGCGAGCGGGCGGGGCGGGCGGCGD
jgi:uncharacterized protein (TIGR04222 family)